MDKYRKILQAVREKSEKKARKKREKRPGENGRAYRRDYVFVGR